MNKTTWESTVKPVVVLSVISLVVSLLLAVVNSMTAPVIAENERAATLAAYVDVMPSVSDANTLEEVSGYTTANVSGAVKAEDGSMAIKAGESGFDGGVLTVIMGFDTVARSPVSGWMLPRRPAASAPTWPRPTIWLSSTAWTVPRISS